MASQNHVIIKMIRIILMTTSSANHFIY